MIALAAILALLSLPVICIKGEQLEPRAVGSSLLQERQSTVVPAAIAGWDDANIILESNGWVQLPSPFFQPKDPRPFPPLHNLSEARVKSSVSILVLIASLRESRAVHSLVSLFETAEHPNRVFVGVVQQNDAQDVDVLEGLCKELGSPLKLRSEYIGNSDMHKRLPGEDDWGQHRFTPESLAACEPASRVRVYRMDAGEAAGPVYARAQQRRLLSSGAAMEDFCLQLDAHAVFTPGWDAQLLQQFATTENEYAVLTTYPNDASTLLPNGKFPNVNNHWEMPHLCSAAIVGRGVVRNDQASAAANLERPALGKLWAAGLSFSRCHAERDVPADPHLKQVFNGEEFSRGARLWTNGYDFYTLSKPVVGVFYGGQKGGNEAWRENAEEMSESNSRLEQLLCRNSRSAAPEALRGFDLGTRRLFDDYVALTGVDPRRGVAKKTSCLVRKWTPWLKGAVPPYQALPAPPLL